MSVTVSVKTGSIEDYGSYQSSIASGVASYQSGQWAEYTNTASLAQYGIQTSGSPRAAWPCSALVVVAVAASALAALLRM